MRYRSCLFNRRRKHSAQFSIRSLIVGTAIISVLLAIGAYACAILVSVTALAVIITDGLATAVHLKHQPSDYSNVTVIRRFWYRSSAPSDRWLTPDPVAIVIIYIAFFAIWHLPLFVIFDLDGGRRFFDLTNGIGVSLRAMDHAANAMVLAYLVVHLAVSLLPCTLAERNYRIPIIVAIVVVTAMHFAIF